MEEATLRGEEKNARRKKKNFDFWCYPGTRGVKEKLLV